MSLSAIMESLPTQTGGIVEIGRIKIGGKEERVRKTQSGSEWRAPVKFDEFVLTTMNKAENGDFIVDKPLMDQLIAEYGDAQKKLRAIPIRLLSDNIDDVMQSSFCWYGGRSIAARSDGVKVTWFNDPKTGKKNPVPVEEDWNPKMLDLTVGGKPMFKLHSNFSCVVAANESRWGGVYRLRTTSIISFRQLHSSLVMLSQLTGGVLIGMPLMLVMRPMQVSPEGKATTVYVVHVELRGGDMQQVQQRALQQMQFRLQFHRDIEKTTAQYRKLLAPPGTESSEDAADIQDEFVPEHEVEAEQTPIQQSPLQQKLAADAAKAKARHEAVQVATVGLPEPKKQTIVEFIQSTATPATTSEQQVAATPEDRKPAAVAPKPIQSALPAKATTPPAGPTKTQEIVDADTGEIIEPAKPAASGAPDLSTQEKLVESLDAYAKSIGLADGVVKNWIGKRIIGRGILISKLKTDSLEWRKESFEIFKKANPGPVDPNLVLRLGSLVQEAGIEDATVEKWCKAAGVTDIGDLPATALAGCITYCETKLAK